MLPENPGMPLSCDDEAALDVRTGAGGGGGNLVSRLNGDV